MGGGSGGWEEVREREEGEGKERKDYQEQGGKGRGMIRKRRGRE